MFNSRSDIGEDRFGDSEGKPTEIILTEAQRKEDVHRRALNTYGTYLESQKEWR